MSLQSNTPVSFSDFNRGIRVTNGNMGIGTTAPAYRLDVVGSLRATSGDVTLGTLLATTSVSSGAVSATNVSAGTIVTTNANITTETVGTSRITTSLLALGNSNTVGSIFTTGGNVGIATNAPRTNLEITQSSSTTGVMLFSGLDDGGVNSLMFNHSSSIGPANAYRKVILQSQALGAGNFAKANFGILVNTTNNFSNASWSDARIFVDGASGQVGIFTTAPSYTLDVAGSLRATSGDVTLGTLLATTSVSSGVVAATNITGTNIVGTAISSGTLNFSTAVASTGITTGTLLATTSVSSGALNATNVTATTITTGILRTPTNATSGILFGTGPWSSIYDNGDLHLWTDDNMYFDVAGASTAGTTRMFINSTGIGMGITSPSYTLDVAGTIRTRSTTGGLLIGSSTDTNRFISALDGDMAVGNSRWIAFGRSNDDSNQAELSFTYYGTSNTGNSLGLGVYGYERMRIRADGNVGIGNTAPASTLDVTGTGRITSTLLVGTSISTTNLLVTNATIANFGLTSINVSNGTVATLLVPTSLLATGNSNTIGNIFTTGGNVGISSTAPGSVLQVSSLMQVVSSGNLLASGDVIAFSSISDARLKKDVENISDQTAIGVVNSLRPVSFTWMDTISNENNRGKRDIGFIAQEVEASSSYAVGEFDDISTGETYKRIKYERLVPYLVGSIKHLTTQLEEYKAELDELRSRIN